MKLGSGDYSVFRCPLVDTPQLKPSTQLCHSLVILGISLYSLGTDDAENTVLCKDRCLTLQLVRRNFVPTLACSGQHRKHSLLYCCLMHRVYRATAWQPVDQIHYIMYTIQSSFVPFLVNKHEINI
jgi:hypothetical protein